MQYVLSCLLSAIAVFAVPTFALCDSVLRFDVKHVQSFVVDSGALVEPDGKGGIWIASAVVRVGLPVTAGAVQQDYFPGICTAPGSIGPTPSRPCNDLYIQHVDGHGNLLYATYAGGTGEQQLADLQVDGEGNALVVVLHPHFHPPTLTTVEALPLRGFRVIPRVLMKFGGSTAGLMFARELGGYDGPFFPAPDGSTFHTSGTRGLDLVVLRPDGSTDRFIPLLSYVNLTNHRMKLGGDGSIYLAGETSGANAEYLLNTAPGFRTFGEATPSAVSYLLQVRLDPPRVASSFASGKIYGGGISDFTILANDDIVAVGDMSEVSRAGSPGSTSTEALGVNDAFAARLGPDLSNLRWLSLLGGEGGESFSQVLAGEDDSLLLIGRTTSYRFPLTADALEPCAATGSGSGIVTELSAIDGVLRYASYLPAWHAPRILRGSEPSHWLLSFAGSAGDLAFYGAPAGEGSRESSLVVAEFAAADAAKRARMCAVNAASFASDMLSAGSLITLFGQNLGPLAGVGAEVTSEQLYPTELGATRVLVDGQSVPLLYVSATQVNCWLPPGLPDSVNIEVVPASAPEQAITVSLREAAPGVFRDDIALSASAWNENGTKNSIQNPAAEGMLLSLFGTGFGLTEPPIPRDGGVAGREFPLTKPPRIWLDSVEAEVIRSGQKRDAPPGVIEIVIRIPAGVTSATPLLGVGLPSLARPAIYLHVSRE